MNFDPTFTVARAGPYIRQILQNGGRATIIVGDQYRMLMKLRAGAFPLPRPVAWWYSCRSRLQVHHPSYVEETPIAGELIRRKEFPKRLSETAIAELLEGAKPEDHVFITPT